MITDEQLKIACDTYNKLSGINAAEPSYMRKALEAYEQSKWVKFDVDDESTYPTVPNKWVNVEVLVYETLNNKVNHDYFNPTYSFNHYNGHVTHWQPLPEFKE